MFANFEVLWLFAKVFSMKFGHVASFDSTSEKFVEVFSSFQPIHVSFLLQNFPSVQ